MDMQLQYVIRYVPPVNPAEAKNFLAGYGVALDLKKTDYLALDDRRASSGTDEAESGKPLKMCKTRMLMHPLCPKQKSGTVMQKSWVGNQMII